MGRIGSFGASLTLHAGVLALSLLPWVEETPQASIAAPTPSLLSFTFRFEPAAPSFEREFPGETAQRNGPADSLPSFEAAPEVETEESVVEIQNPPPAYPAAARRRRLEGHAIVDVKILKDGSVAEPRVVECAGSPLFAEAALDAVRSWRYAPLRAERAHRVRFEFKLRA